MLYTSESAEWFHYKSVMCGGLAGRLSLGGISVIPLLQFQPLADGGWSCGVLCYKPCFPSMNGR
jgi:hypothetical protein